VTLPRRLGLRRPHFAPTPNELTEGRNRGLLPAAKVPNEPYGSFYRPPLLPAVATTATTAISTPPTPSAAPRGPPPPPPSTKGDRASGLLRPVNLGYAGHHASILALLESRMPSSVRRNRKVVQRSPSSAASALLTGHCRRSIDEMFTNIYPVSSKTGDSR